MELKSILQCSFADCKSAFNFISHFNEDSKQSEGSLTNKNFTDAVVSLTSGRFKQAEIQKLWQSMSRGATTIDYYGWRQDFEKLTYTGKSVIKSMCSFNKN